MASLEAEGIRLKRGKKICSGIKEQGFQIFFFLILLDGT